MPTPEAGIGGGSVTERGRISVYLVDDVPELRELVKYGMEDDPDVAIIVLSGFSADRMGPPTLERGADLYIEKGIPMEELRDATRTAVAERRSD
jgi:DNA-binding NarL/FixJ family response regulator